MWSASRRWSAGFVLAVLLSLSGVRGQEAPDPDAIFRHQPGVTSDRAAGIGKRVKPGATLVLADLRGPAVIRHLWMTNTRAVEPAVESDQVTIEFHWDDRPAVVIPLHDFFGDRFTGDRERSFRMALGKNAYYPMPFRDSARIEIRNRSRTELVGVYWQIDYDKVGGISAGLDYFTGNSRIAAAVSLGATAGSWRQIRAGGGLAAQGILPIASIEGPAVIRRITLSFERKPDPEDVITNRGVVIRMFWDDEREPSVEAPLADFFGTGFGARRDFTSAAWSQSGPQVTIRFPMPFKRRARIELANLTGGSVGPFAGQIEYEPRGRDFLDADLEYFHACFRMSRPVPLNSTHVAMETTGSGKFVGLVWSCHWLNAEQKPEGTQNFWVDGGRIQSTGSEDYFGRAWGFGSAPECHGFKGIDLGPEKSASAEVPAEWRRVTAYRAHVLDPIRFQKSLKLDFTCYGYNRGHRTDEYATTCFWYQVEPHAPFAPLPAYEDLLPIDHPDSLGFGLYRIHRCAAARDFVAAIRSVDGLVHSYPRNRLAEVLQFKKASLLEELGRKADAIKILQALQRTCHDAELSRDIADKLWLLDEPGRLLIKAAAPSNADLFLDGKRIELPREILASVPDWGQPEIYRFTYPPMKVAWSSPSSAVMRLPMIRMEVGTGHHVLAVKASAATEEPIFTPRVGYFFATLDVAGPDIVTDATWRMSDRAEDRWQEPGFDDAKWKHAAVHPLSEFGDGAWTWLWPRGFANFPGHMERIWAPAIFPEDRNFRRELWFRREFTVPGEVD